MKNGLHKFKIYKNGFTLAEVLITLVIIGVVAAMTIPTAINNMQDQERKTQFAKAYSTIKQAMYETEMKDFFGYAECYYGSGTDARVSQCTAFFNALSKNLSLQKVCAGNAKTDGCVPTYKSYATSSGCNGFSENNINKYNTVYVLSDGQIIIPYGGMPLFILDINGHKGPNASGFDVHSFRIFRNKDNTGLYLEDDGCLPLVSGGKMPSRMIQYSLSGRK